MRRLWLIALLALTACSTSSSTGSPTASAGTQSPSAATSALPVPSPTPTPVATLPCKMPVTLGYTGGTVFNLGWIALPSETTTQDPVNHIDQIQIGSSYMGVTDHSPQLYGERDGSWSVAAGKWFPVTPELIAPDGLHYTYLHADGTIRIADVNGQESTIQNQLKLTPLAWQTPGIVLTGTDVFSSGLWLLDPASQSITPLVPQAGHNDWREVSGTTAWGVDSPGVLGYPPGTSVLKASVASAGAAANAYTAPTGETIALIAADTSGGLLVAVAGSAPTLVYIARGGAASTFSEPVGLSLGPRHHADAHGIWFLGLSGVYLFNPSSGLQSIGAGLTADLIPGGDCV